jgi:hypothetical protein
MATPAGRGDGHTAPDSPATGPEMTGVAAGHGSPVATRPPPGVPREIPRASAMIERKERSG